MFNGIWLVASEPLTIRGRVYQIGERFHISRTQSGILLVTGQATIDPSQAPSPAPDATPEQPARRRRGRPRKVQPEESDNSTMTVDPPSRRYRRRDLTAEDTAAE